ncbi:MAG: hypothetical protein CR217_11530 [Beijerinckiaceae bacterium]|nr:MAG: hypothetical protein CR217_11530 [Beijerinckiaceae bacterium]
MNVEDAKAALVGLEGKLAAAKDRRDKIVIEISSASAKAAAIGGIGDQSAKNSLGPLNKQAAAAESEMALIRIELREAKRRLELAEAYSESVKAKQATERGEVKRSVLLEISAPDGRTIRQFHQSLAAAQKALQPGYVVTGQVIGAGVVSPIGAATQSFMASLLAAHGDELVAFLAERGIKAA